MTEGNEVPLILVLCTGNSCRSHLAEGILRAAAGESGRFRSSRVAALCARPRTARPPRTGLEEKSGPERDCSGQRLARPRRQDRAFLDELLDAWVTDAGYTRSIAAAGSGALTKMSVLAPSPTLLNVGSSALERWRAASSTTRDRLRFAGRFSAAKRVAGLTA